jgi:hypothetical protein
MPGRSPFSFCNSLVDKLAKTGFIEKTFSKSGR